VTGKRSGREIAVILDFSALSIRPLKPLGRCRPRSAPASWRVSPLLPRRSPDRHGRGVDYPIALVERVSAFFIMLVGFE
jgi:hypothetical protein